MTDEKKEAIVRASVRHHRAYALLVAAGMWNTYGKTAEEMVSQSVDYDLLKAEWLEARAALDEAMKP